MNYNLITENAAGEVLAVMARPSRSAAVQSGRRVQREHSPEPTRVFVDGPDADLPIELYRFGGEAPAIRREGWPE